MNHATKENQQEIQQKNVRSNSIPNQEAKYLRPPYAWRDSPITYRPRFSWPLRVFCLIYLALAIWALNALL